MPGYQLSGVTCVVAGDKVQLTLKPSATIASDTISGSDGAAGGTFAPAPLSLTNASGPQVLAYSNATPGTYTLTLTSSQGYPIVGSPFTLVVEAAPTSQASRRRKRWFPGL